MRSQADSLNPAEISFASAELGENAARRPASIPSINEAEFRVFYENTASQLRGYLRRVTGDASAADDLLQESYLRLLRAPLAPTEDAHRKHYLFRIATNLLRDHFRAAKRSFAPLDEKTDPVSADRDFGLARDFEKLLLELKPRERELLWLAYVEGYRHDEIAKLINCRSASIRPMLFRARGWKRDSHGVETP